MDDLVCRPPLNYTPVEPLVCQEPPEPLVCEAPPPKKAAPPPPPKDNYTSTTLSNHAKASTKGKSNSAYNFLDLDNKVCQEPEPKAEAPPVNTDPNPMEANMCLMPAEPEHLTPLMFTANLENSNLVADLNLSLKDSNGFNQRSQDDMSGEITHGSISVNHEMFDQSLYGLKGTVKRNDAEKTTTTVQNVTFDNADKAYVFKLKVEKKLWKIPVWDHFEVRFKVNDKGQLTAKLEDNWFPDKKILGQLEATIRDSIRQKVPKEYSNFTLNMHQNGAELTLVPDVKDLEVPIAKQGAVKIQHMAGEQAKFKLDEKGNINIQLDHVQVSGSTGTAPAKPSPAGEPADTADVQVKIGIAKDNSRQVYAKGKVAVHLNETETQSVAVNGEKLSNYFQSGTIQNDFSLYWQRQPGQEPKIQSRNYVAVEQAKMGDQTVNLKTNLQLEFDPEKGIRLDSQEQAYAPLNLNTTQNGVEFMVNGAEYFPEMKKLIGQARESIDLETYMLHDDPAGQEVSYLLARKAAGLTAEGKSTKVSAESPQGVPVRFIFNSWQGSKAGGEESEAMIIKMRDKVIHEIDQSSLSPADKAKAKIQLEQNFKWKFFTDGILRSDHRKVLVVDGAQATVGGMNIADKYLATNAFHDVMLKVAGPEVRNIHREFTENWYEFNHLPPPTAAEMDTMLKSDDDLNTQLLALQAQGKYKDTANMATLVTDDRQTDIKKGILKVIDEANHEINIEQAFFADATINKHLAEAMRKGVHINVIVSKTPMIGMFGPANLLSAYELAKVKKEGAKGDIHLYYYDDPRGGDSRLIHTKAISADGKTAVIGSANMIGRSLSSPFVKLDEHAQPSQALYNKELSLYVEKPEFVEQINQRLFNKDIMQNSQELDGQAIEDLVEKSGGEAELRKKAAAAPFT